MKKIMARSAATFAIVFAGLFTIGLIEGYRNKEKKK